MMRVVPGIVLSVFSLLVCARPVHGQELGSWTEVRLTVQQMNELKAWLNADADWQTWHEQWGNHARVKQRNRPEAPDWLAAECVDLIGGEGVLFRGCRLLENIRRESMGLQARRVTSAQVLLETRKKTSFIERIHVGGGWPLIMDANALKYGAIIETHVSILSLGRLEMNLPGVVLLSVPDEKGQRTVRPGTDVGVSLKVSEFRFLGTQKTGILYMNLSNAWISAQATNGFGYQQRLSLVGLSVTMKKRKSP